MIPLTLTRFPVPPLPSYSKHWQHLYDQRALLLSYLTKGHVTSMYNFSPGCPSNFSLAWRCLFFRRGVFLGQQPHSPFPSGSLVSVFIETSVPDLDKSFTSVFAFVLGTLETSHNSFLYKVFDIFHFLHLFSTMWVSSNFLIMLLTAVLASWKYFNKRVNASPLLALTFLFLKSKPNFFVFAMMTLHVILSVVLKDTNTQLTV